LKTYPQIEEPKMTLTNLSKHRQGGVMLMVLNLLSQPAQAISVKFSFANLSGNILPRGADQLITGTIDGLVEGDNTGLGVTATILSSPSGEFLGVSIPNGKFVGGYDFDYTSTGGPGAFIVTGGNITSIKARFYNQHSVLNFGTAGVASNFPNGLSQVSDLFTLVPPGTTFVRAFSDYTQPATFTPIAVPWETDALPVIGSTFLFGLGLWARNKFAKPLQK